MPQSPPSPIARQIPKKWLLAIVVALIAYGLLQPIVQQRLGWNLPPLASNSQDVDEAVQPKSSHPARELDSATSNAESPLGTTQSNRSPSSQDSAPDNTTPPSVNAKQPKASGTAITDKAITTESSGQRQTSAPQAKDKSATSTQTDLLYGRLREVSTKRYVSPAGLLYLPGSEEGHRLQHLQRHLQDMPDRPGKHGVFEGDMAQVLDWIDDAYTRGQRGGRGIRKMEEDGRTIYEVPFDKPIGYVGGRDGGHSFNPAAKRLRLVVDGNKFITAFPF